MISPPEPIYDSVSSYRDIFRAAHAGNVASCFEELFQQSGVDAEGNARTVAQLRLRKSQLPKIQRRNRWKRIIRGGLILFGVLLVGSGGYALARPAEFAEFLEILNVTLPRENPVLVDMVLPIGCAVLGCLLFAAVPGLSRKIAVLDAEIAALEKEISELTGLSWQQMAPLNALYPWNVSSILFSKTLPMVCMDPYFNAQRMELLSRRFNLPPSPGNQSTLFVQSGEILGNPFVFATDVRMEMGEETYEGTLEISWVEHKFDEQTKTTSRITRSQTLYATVTEPKPFYFEKTSLYYGNDAAPDLIFSRQPGMSHTLSQRQREKKIASGTRKLESLARDAVKHGRSFSDMTNKEFDVLFNAWNRDHAVQFNLLFTPLAQQEMVRLLTDGSEGYGDDFIFEKRRRLNIIKPEHLQSLNFAQSPVHWHSNCLADARAYFNSFNNDYFRRIYFAFAPLFVIPLYQQHKPHEYIYKDVLGHRRLSSFEHEAAVNFLGYDQFAHPNSATRSILKTQVLKTGESSEAIEVTAHGFAAEERLSHVTVHGDDGKDHKVPVHWIEYIPVQRQGRLLVAHEDASSTAANARGYKNFKLIL